VFAHGHVLQSPTAALEGDMLGAKLDRGRIQLALRQIDAARPMASASSATQAGSLGGEARMVAQYPAIISFMGKGPWREPTTLGEQLRAERRRLGRSIARSALSIRVDASRL